MDFVCQSVTSLKSDSVWIALDVFFGSSPLPDRLCIAPGLCRIVNSQQWALVPHLLSSANGKGKDRCNNFLFDLVENELIKRANFVEMNEKMR